MSDFDPVQQITLITNLIPRLAQMTDFGTLEDYAALLAEDFVWEFPGSETSTIPPSVVEGRDVNVAGSRSRRESGTQGPGSHTRHVVSSTSVQPDPDSPTAVTYFSFYGDTHQTPVLRMMGVYHDQFRRDAAGNWILARRTVVID